jgi:hypothetical protein
LKLLCYPLGDRRPNIRPAPRSRDWMDRTPDEYAYRCLPLAIANQHGWELLSDGTHEAIWNGGDGLDDMDVSSSDGATAAASHFGHGILTFHVSCILRTEPGINLWICGSANRHKDGIAPLSGLIEADWMPYTFTMNWQFTRANHRVRFEEGEPICSFFPVPRGLVESAEPEFRSLDSDPATRDDYRTWSADRDKLNDQIRKNLETARERGWQKNYFQGRRPDGERFRHHQTKLQVKPFRDRA